MNPKFIGIGAQKAGTSWLYARLNAHPDVWMPYQKELHYWDEKVTAPRRSLRQRMRGNHPVDVRWRIQMHRWTRNRTSWSPGELWWWARYFSTSRYSDEWYLRQFAPAGNRMAGDISPGYALIDSDGVRRVQRLCPEAPIIFLLRHPVERAWSHAVMQLAWKGAVSDDEFLRHFASPAAVSRSDYLTSLETWTAVFPVEQMFVGFFEDIVLRPSELLDAVCDFIGLSHLPSRRDEVGKAANKGRTEAIPARHARRLAELYLPLAESVAGRVGGYADWWVYSTEQLIELSDDEPDVPYPFLHGSMFDTWKAQNGIPAGELPPMASAPLDQVLARAGA